MCGPKEGSISKGRSVKMKYVVSLKTYVCTAKHLAKFFPTFFKIPATFCPRTPFWKIAFFFIIEKVWIFSYTNITSVQLRKSKWVWANNLKNLNNITGKNLTTWFKKYLLFLFTFKAIWNIIFHLEKKKFFWK